jgi:hypothetical protein
MHSAIAARLRTSTAANAISDPVTKARATATTSISNTTGQNNRGTASDLRSGPNMSSKARGAYS